MATASQTVTIKIDLDIGDALRSTLVALGWTPPPSHVVKIENLPDWERELLEEQAIKDTEETP